MCIKRIKIETWLTHRVFCKTWWDLVLCLKVKCVTRYWRNRLYLSFRTFTITKAWWTAVYGVVQSLTWLEWFCSSSSSMHILIWFGEYLITSSFKWVIIVVVMGSPCFRALPGRALRGPRNQSHGCRVAPAFIPLLQFCHPALADPWPHPPLLDSQKPTGRSHCIMRRPLSPFCEIILDNYQDRAG